MVKNLRSGQGLIEVVFAIGVIVLVLAVVISLVVSSVRSQTAGNNRKKAAELGQKVVEQLVLEKQQDPMNFWDIGSTGFWKGINLDNTQTMTGYEGYNYAIGFSQVVDVGTSCTVNPIRCAVVTVGVGYNDSNSGSVVFTRFFSR